MRLIPIKLNLIKLIVIAAVAIIGTYFIITSQAQVSLTGDINNDHVVNILDLRILGKNWGLGNRTASQGDLTGDGNVDILDLRI